VKRGFTLIELIVTLFVLALAVGVAAPSIARGVDTLRTRAEAAGIATFVRAARERAIARNLRYEVRVRTDHGLVELLSGDTVTASRRLAPGVRITADPPTARVITFLPHGMSSGGRLRVEMPGQRSYLITVDSLTGRVTTRRLDL
jgi:prepilin-type N-terminal cleavage/methylation domain-containing protein